MSDDELLKLRAQIEALTSKKSDLLVEGCALIKRIAELQAANSQLRARVAELEDIIWAYEAAAAMNAHAAAAADDHERGQIATFVDKVRQMRALQVEYFRTRSKETLVASKRIEAEIDRAISNDILFIEILKRVPKELKF